MPQCGFRFQLAENNNEIYFRNKGPKENEKSKSTQYLKLLNISKDETELVYNTDSRISQLLLKRKFTLLFRK